MWLASPAAVSLRLRLSSRAFQEPRVQLSFPLPSAMGSFLLVWGLVGWGEDVGDGEKGTLLSHGALVLCGFCVLCERVCPCVSSPSDGLPLESWVV